MATHESRILCANSVVVVPLGYIIMKVYLTQLVLLTESVDANSHVNKPCMSFHSRRMYTILPFIAL